MFDLTQSRSSRYGHTGGSSQSRSVTTLAGVRAWWRSLVPGRKVALVLAGIVLLYLSAMNGHFPLGRDSAKYVGVAESLAAGRGFVFNGERYNASPIGYPLLLTPIVYFFGRNFLVMKVFSIICAVCAIWIFYMILRHKGESALAPTVALATGTSLHFFLAGTNILTEAPYALFSLSSILFLNLSVSKGKLSIGWLALGMAMAGCALGIRSSGVALLPTIIAGLIFLWPARSGRGIRRNRRRWSVLAALCLIGGLILLWHFGAWDSGSIRLQGSFFLKDDYHPELGQLTIGEFVLRSAREFIAYASLVGTFLFPVELALFLMPFFVVIFLGYVSLIRGRRADFLEIYFAFYWVVIVAFPAVRTRYMIPLIPCFAFYFMVGLEALKRQASSRRKEDLVPAACLLISLILVLPILRHKSIAPSIGPYSTGYFLFILFFAGCLICLGAVCLVGSWREAFARHMPGIVLSLCVFLNLGYVGRRIATEHASPYYEKYDYGRWQSYRRILEYVRANTNENTRVVTPKPSMMHLWTGRRAFGIPLIWDPHTMLAYVEQTGSAYLVVDSHPETRIFARVKPMLEQFPRRFRLIIEAGDAWLYEVLPDTGSQVHKEFDAQAGG